jgi:hypothetical protein
MPPARFEPKITESERPQSHALNARPLGSAELQALVFDNGAQGDLTIAVDTGAVTTTTASWSAICNAS